jgi:hypothetical protein
VQKLTRPNHINGKEVWGVVGIWRGWERGLGGKGLGGVDLQVEEGLEGFRAS